MMDAKPLNDRECPKGGVHEWHVAPSSGLTWSYTAYCQKCNGHLGEAKAEAMLNSVAALESRVAELEPVVQLAAEASKSIMPRVRLEQLRIRALAALRSADPTKAGEPAKTQKAE